jgi:hypothetical protein
MSSFAHKNHEPAAASHGAHDGHAQPEDEQTHIITAGALGHLRKSGPAGREAAKQLYDNTNAYIVLKGNQHIPKGWDANATRLFSSEAKLEHAVKSGSLPKSTDAVVYDNEHWNQTPENEKADPAKYARKFGNIAHSLGDTFIAAPTEKYFNGDAKYADIIDAQLQGRETHTGAWEKALRHDVNYAHHYNPDEKVIGQISSNVHHLDPRADHSAKVPEGIDKAEQDLLRGSTYSDGFWGYLYQQNKASIKAGDEILKDVAAEERKGRDV